MAVKLAINQSDILKGGRIHDVLFEAVGLKTQAALSHLKGKWYRNDVWLVGLSESGLLVEFVSDQNYGIKELQIDQPVGLSFQIEHHKYILESVIIGFETTLESGQGRILLELPDRMEKMLRRVYERQPVPDAMTIQVLFWHRGYVDNAPQVPGDSYWQGKLINVSAGGAGVLVGLNQKSHFKTGQLVGLQFTPQCYQKPIMSEAQVVHLEEDAEGLHLGLEFLGLEGSVNGRDMLHRLLDTVGEYRKLNHAGPGVEQ